MPRPRNKTDLIKAANEQYDKLLEFTNSMSETELNTDFDFSNDPKKKERHWDRDKNLRDIFVHLYEWHQLMLRFLENNAKGDYKSFIPEPYTWKTYGEMNQAFYEKHQQTSLEEARKMLEKSHKEVLAKAMQFSEAELFEKGVYKLDGTSVLGSYFVSVMPSHYDWALKKLKAHRKNLS